MLDTHARVGVGGEFRQRGERFALASAGQIAQAVAVDELGLARLDKHRLRKWKLAGLETQPHALRHRAPQRNDPAAELARDLDHLANPMQMRRKGRQEKPAARTRRELAQDGLERAFRARAAGALDVGRIREQDGNAFRAKLGEAFAIEQLAVHRGLIDLEVTAMNDDPRGSSNRQRNRVRGRMRNPNRLDRERPSLECNPRHNRPQIDRIVELRISQAPASESERYIGSVNGNVEAAEQMRERADVILVGVGEHDRLNREMAALQPRHLGYIGTQSERGLVGEHHPAIDHNRAPGAFDRHQVEADFAQPAQRHNSDRSGRGSACRHRPILPPHQGELYRSEIAGERRGPAAVPCLENGAGLVFGS